MRSREEHLEWCKKRALEYLPNVKEALTSMMSDITKHPETKNHPGNRMCIGLMMAGSLQTPDEARRFIEGYR
jgi:hypothetical protein